MSKYVGKHVPILWKVILHMSLLKALRSSTTSSLSSLLS